MWRWPWQKPPKPVKPPKVGCTRAPAAGHRIDFSKPHDFYSRFGYDKDGATVFRRCVLIGFTTPTENETGESVGSGEYAHNRWLVLRQADGHLVYVPRDRLLYIEESAVP